MSEPLEYLAPPHFHSEGVTSSMVVNVGQPSPEFRGFDRFAQKVEASLFRVRGKIGIGCCGDDANR